MKNSLKCNQNLNIVTVFSNVDGIMTHLANIDKRTNRIYSTYAGYRLIATDDFYKSHEANIREFDEEEDFEKAPYRKFNVSISFNASELHDIIKMCSRELVW